MANLPLIKEYFDASGRTDQEIADIIDKSVSVVEGYRQGIKPRGTTLAHLAYALGVSPFALADAYLVKS